MDFFFVLELLDEHSTYMSFLGTWFPQKHNWNLEKDEFALILTMILINSVFVFCAYRL
jgi:hypothetical protein